MTSDDKTMLVLAALTYRGFLKASEAAIHRDLQQWLPKLPPLGLGTWDLVWGPASFRNSTSLADDAMMFVARQRDTSRTSPPRFAVAIRGTNPVSLFDWVFGDFWVRLPIPWSESTQPAAKVSASTALGLAIAQHLAAEDPPSGGSRLARFADDLAAAAQGVADRVSAFAADLALTNPDSLDDSVVAERVQRLASAAEGALTSESGDRLLNVLGSVAQPLQHIEMPVFHHLLQRIASTQDAGETLLDFMNRAVPDGAVVSVTGHSKGGALAVAAALWLDEKWAGGHGAQIECFSFAGPTAGNSAFVEHYNARLAARTRRIVNPRDLVPHAWVPAELERLRQFYPLLGPALTLLSRSVAHLHYMHVGGDVIHISSQRRAGTFAAEAIYHHLDAYLHAAGLDETEWNARSLLLETVS
jgi:hypothetical protein